MFCEETRPLLSLYVDDGVSLPARVAIDDHLDRCPVCRSEVAELRALKRRLSLLTSPAPPADLAATISGALAIEAAARRHAPNPSLRYRIARFLEPRLMPYSISSFASIVMFFVMLTALRPHVVALHEAAAAQQGGVVILSTSDFLYDLNKPVKLRPEDFAASRAPWTVESPTLDPGGALATSTSVYARSHLADDMLLVADVFSNGTASVAGVVNPPRDKRMLDEFESALRQDAAFVPASLDGRPGTMRVAFTVQKVDVDDRN